jgi:hypothetical protein
VDLQAGKQLGVLQVVVNQGVVVLVLTLGPSACPKNARDLTFLSAHLRGVFNVNLINSPILSLPKVPLIASNILCSEVCFFLT